MLYAYPGGDGFFVLEDLYGSEGLIFCPETEPINPGTLPAKPSVQGLLSIPPPLAYS